MQRTNKKVGNSEAISWFGFKTGVALVRDKISYNHSWISCCVRGYYKSHSVLFLLLFSFIILGPAKVNKVKFF